MVFWLSTLIHLLNIGYNELYYTAIPSTQNPSDLIL